ncbi:hypothetical protein E3J84_05265 [Candidatus Aerophobetes bacterium]|uniref:Methyltransferase domain-containing protein n=1 Tax=Aerophobetes bacterium TaxID=2030807 RepID=A0A523RU68_UNCAE|nr:MAG: hypothetical protein E3J84_05265 [Candidatus Aerophobetes bacterium]
MVSKEGILDSYEIPKGFTRITDPFRMIGVWFASRFPVLGKFLFVKHSRRGRRVRKYAATHKALELVYTYTWNRNRSYGLADQILTHILFNFRNAKALRNRLRLVNKGLKQAILDSKETPETIISLGSGSARDLVEVMAELRNELIDYHPTILLVDRSRSALRYSEAMTRVYKVNDVADWILVHAKTEDFIQGAQEKADIVLMIGLMDYLEEKRAVAIVSGIYDQMLQPGGTLFASNIVANEERRFLDCVLNWPMIYREDKELEEIISNSGFEKENFKILYEPLGIHGVIVARK